MAAPPVLADDGEARARAASRRRARRPRRAGATAGLTTTSSPGATSTTCSPTDSTTPATSQPGHVREGAGAGSPAVSQRSMWLRADATGPDPHVVGPDGWVVDLALAVGPGRLVQDPGAHGATVTRAPGTVGGSDDAGEGVGLDSDAERAAGPRRGARRRATPVSARSRSIWSGGPAADGDAGVRQVASRSAAGSGPRAGRRATSVHVEDVEQPVAGVRPRRHVPPAEELGVHHRHDRGRRQPRAPGDEVGDEPVRHAVDEHRADVDRHADAAARPEARLVARAADACGTGRRRAGRAAGRAHRPGVRPRRRRGPRRRPHDDPTVGSPPGSPHASPLRTVTAHRGTRTARPVSPGGDGSSPGALPGRARPASPSDPSRHRRPPGRHPPRPRPSRRRAPTRSTRRRGAAPRPPARAARAVAGSGAMSPICRTRSRSCLDVADEVAAREVLVVEHVVERVAGRPRVGERR